MFLNNTQLHTLIPCMVYQPISPYPRSPSRLSHWYHHTIQTGLNRPTTQLWLISLETLKYPTCTSTITWYVIWYLGKANTSNNWLDLLYHLDQPTHHTLTHEFQEVTSKKRKKNRDKECLPVSSSTLTTMPDSLRVATRVIIDCATSDHSPHTQISKRKRRKKKVRPSSLNTVVPLVDYESDSTVSILPLISLTCTVTDLSFLQPSPLVYHPHLVSTWMLRHWSPSA